MKPDLKAVRTHGDPALQKAGSYLVAGIMFIAFYLLNRAYGWIVASDWIFLVIGLVGIGMFGVAGYRYYHR
ncbi:hypothetical protein JXB02_05600 [Candidatus Woesearchaeota archaeon]|nr:hypothetical protein [Candidatus Woesearchaeota archaeon]